MRRSEHGCVAAIYPSARGFAFAIFEGPDRPIDWGLKNTRDRRRTARQVRLAKELLLLYRPTVLIVEDHFARRSRRSPRMRRLNRSLLIVGGRLDMDVHRLCRDDIRQHFVSDGNPTKHEIASVISKRLPCFEHWLPPVRKSWMTEDVRMSLFDAVALVLTFYGRERDACRINGR